MNKEGGFSLLFAVAKSCVDNEETIRMCMQVLRVIAFMGSTHLAFTTNRPRNLASSRAEPLSSHGNGVQIALIVFFSAASQSVLHALRSEVKLYLSLFLSSHFFLVIDLDDLLDTHVIQTIAVILERHREPRLLRVSYILLYNILMKAKESSFSFYSIDFSDQSARSQGNRRPSNHSSLRVRHSVHLDYLRSARLSSQLPHSGLQKQYFLFSLSHHSVQIRRLLYSLNIITILFKFIRISNVPLNVQELCIALLSRLAALQPCREVIVEQGGVATLLSFIHDNTEESVCVFCGLSCIGYLTFHSFF